MKCTIIAVVVSLSVLAASCDHAAPLEGAVLPPGIPTSAEATAWLPASGKRSADLEASGPWPPGDGIRSAEAAGPHGPSDKRSADLEAASLACIHVRSADLE